MRQVPFSAVLCAIFGTAFIAAGVFAIMVFKDFAHYSSNSTEIVAEARDLATESQKAEDEELFTEALKGTQFENIKNPLKYAHFKAPSQFATIEFDYPLTWAVYEKNEASKTTDANRYDVYFDVGSVTSTQYAQPHSLLVSIVNTSYEKTLEGFRKNVDSGALIAIPYSVPGHEGDVDYSGVRLDGQLETGVSGVMLILKTREKSLLIRSDLAATMDDFEKIVLPSFTFLP
jgi:hypothetical protein